MVLYKSRWIILYPIISQSYFFREEKCMKKIINIVSLLFVIGTVFAQSKKFEGYDKLSWGTTLEEFKQQNPSAYDQTNEKNRTRNEKLFYKDGNSVTRVYRFFDNKLCWGRTVYINPSEATVMAVVEKLKDEYGTLYNFNEGKDKDCDYYVLTWYVSSNLTVMLEAKDMYNSYDRISSSLLFITYQNDKTMVKIEDYEKQQRKKDLEL